MASGIVYVPLLFTLKRDQTKTDWRAQEWRAVAAEVAADQYAQAPHPVSHAIERSPVAGLVRNMIAVLVTLVLDRRDVPAYLVNIAHGEPVVYASVEEREDRLIVHHVTASAFAIDTMVGSIDRVPMSASVRRAIRTFVDQQIVSPQPRPVQVPTPPRHLHV